MRTMFSHRGGAQCREKAGELVEQPRNQAVEVVKFPGINRSCLECRKNVYDHFRNHLVFHLQCKFCSFQLASLEDNQFWEKVWIVCGKVFSTNEPKKINWHAKVHEDNEDFKCNKCDSKFKRNFTLKRHMEETLGEQFYLDPVEEGILKLLPAVWWVLLWHCVTPVLNDGISWSWW